MTNNCPHGRMILTGNKTFKLPATTFIISPLSKDTDVYIKGIVEGIDEDEVLFGTTDANDYATVQILVPYVEFYLDTDETFYVRW